MMVISKADVELLQRFAISDIAQLLGLPNADVREDESLLAEMRTRNEDAYDRLLQFLSAFWAWFEFHRTLDEAGSSVTVENQPQFLKLVAEKDTAREALIEVRKRLVSANRA